MPNLYPTLEDMNVDHMQQAQNSLAPQVAAPAPAAIQYPPPYGAANPTYGTAPAYGAAPSAGASLYPSLDDYMGLDLALVRQTTPQNQQVAPYAGSGQTMVAPVSGNDVGIKRAEIKNGIRELVCCKDGNGKIGLRVRAVNKGLFVAFVHKNSPASMVGLRFGDQILQIDGKTVAGWDTEKAMEFLKKTSPEKITFAVRDRPFERTITMQKDSSGHIGFVFKSGKITHLVKDSSACRNGVLTDHQLIEVNGQNVVGLKDKEIGEIIDESPATVTITIMPTVLYEHIVKW
ncbi:SDCBP [Bugula neritina]|uniref:SDCBP n=1 Tax=Bugula neritina TaxID=10212 RepID=A0A7J7JVI4_BUGNE|nr:SDCBP [Bugula neritina]